MPAEDRDRVQRTRAAPHATTDTAVKLDFKPGEIGRTCARLRKEEAKLVDTLRARVQGK